MTSRAMINKMKHIILILSCACIIYALFLMFIKFVDMPNDLSVMIDNPPPWLMVTGMVLALCTLPFTYLIFILLSINIIIMHLNKWSIKSEYLISTLILLAAMVLLCVATTIFC